MSHPEPIGLLGHPFATRRAIAEQQKGKAITPLSEAEQVLLDIIPDGEAEKLSAAIDEFRPALRRFLDRVAIEDLPVPHAGLGGMLIVLSEAVRAAHPQAGSLLASRTLAKMRGEDGA